MVLILAALLLFLHSCHRQEQSVPKPQAIRVSTVTVKGEEISVPYETKAYLEAEKDVVLRPEVNGRVLELYVDEGSYVKRGQRLLRIDPSQYENTVRQLEAQLQQARVQYQNLEDIVRRREFLFQKDLIAKEDLQNVKTQLRSQEEVIRSLKAQLDNARLELSKTVLRAPFDGYIAQRMVNVGDYLTVQSQTFRLVTLDPIKAVFQVPQELLPYVKEGTEISLRVESVGERKGKVFFVSPVADNNRMITVKALLANNNRQLKPGMYGVVSIPTQKLTLFRLPENAVVLRGTQKVVWRISQNTAQPVNVEVVLHQNGTVYVKGDLKDGDRIAVENAFLLREGAKVEER